MSITESIQNGLAVSGAVHTAARNADGEFSGRQTPYFSNAQNRLAALYGKYASDCYEGSMQGYDPENFYTYYPVKLRCTDVSREAAGTNLSDDVKGMVVYYPEGVNFVPIGAMVRFASNDWLVTNPANISSILTESIIRRCNAVYKRLDWYGNVLTCPFNNPKMQPRGAQDDYRKNMILADHYFTCSMQLNEVSAEIHENTRMILGDAAYSVRGLNNFTQAFTGDEDSVHIIYFQLQREEEVSVYDDMERKIADGLAFSWEISLAASISMREGQTQTILPTSTRNGAAVTSTEKNPVNYVFASSDESVLTVGQDGTVYAAGEGSAAITVSLAQNPNITQTAEITVTAAEAAYVSFAGALPSAVAEQESVKLTASFYEYGQATDERVTFSFSGAPPRSYSAEIDGNTITITCWEPSDTPLTVTAKCGGRAAMHTLALEGW